MRIISQSISHVEDCPWCKGNGCDSCKNTGKIAKFKREVRVWRDEDMIFISEREGRFNGRTRRGHVQYKWADDRVALTLGELTAIVATHRYIEKKETADAMLSASRPASDQGA